MLDAYLPVIEEALARAVSDARIPEGLRESMAYSLLSGGKRLRAALCLACCALTGGDAAAALPIACGVEMIHAYSLVHDDLPCMDDDDMRRGKPASHKVYGEAGAVLAGDALLSHAFEWMLANAPGEPRALSRYVRAMHAVAQGAGAWGMVAGQSLELSGALSKGTVSLEDVHSRKTGALIRAAARAGGCVAGAQEIALRAVEAFAAHYGALFQITDDMLDAPNEAGDARNYVCAYGMRGAQEAAAAHAREALAALAPFGESAGELLALVEETLHRAR